MAAGNEIYRFGLFELDSARLRLTRGGQDLAPPETHVRVLLRLVSTPGRIVSQRELIDAGWGDLAVTPNSLDQAISGLRALVGKRPGGLPLIENVARKGYRFAGDVECITPAAVPIDARLAPELAFLDQRSGLESLKPPAIAKAISTLEGVVQIAPLNPSPRIGLALAYVLDFESKRADLAPDVTRLHLADRQAREAWQRDPASGYPSIVLAFALNRLGQTREAIAAARHGCSLAADNWHHWVCLAYVSWGEERRRAAREIRRLFPDHAFAEWFFATVSVARQLWDQALDELRAGCAAQDAQWTQTDRFHGVGLHFLHGRVLAALGRCDEAIAEEFRELACEDKDNVYSREACANAWYTIGALRLRQGRVEEAAAAFREALGRVPGHLLATVGLAAATTPGALASLLDTIGDGGGNAVDVAIAKAALLTLLGKHEEAAQLCAEALLAAEPGSAGWLLPVDPLINPTARPEAWSHTLAIVRHRAA